MALSVLISNKVLVLQIIVLSFEDFFKKETTVTEDGFYTLEFIAKLGL